MHIAIVGTGRVGRALGLRWAANGHTVAFGAREPDAPAILELLVRGGERVRVGLPQAVVQEADVVVLAVPGGVAPDVAAELAVPRDRILVDCTNPVAPGGGGLTVGTVDSGAEAIARRVPQARVVKSFNTTGSGNMARSDYPGGRLIMPVCGDDAGAREVVAGLAAELGFEVVDCGPLSSARLLEPVALLWITLAHRLGRGPDFGFALLER